MTCGGCPTSGIPNPSFASVRAAKCAACGDSAGDICLPIEALHPGKSSISRGTRRPELRCPKPTPEWIEEPRNCPRCGRQRQIFKRSVGHCFICENLQAIRNKNEQLKPKPRAKPRPIGFLRERIVPARMDWFVAVTTAPRQNCTLAKCIRSLRRAGWEPTVFAEPGATKTDCQTIDNESRLGCWHNWLSSARWALANTDANLIMTVQDDSLFHPDSKTFAESILWPDKNVGYLSLYTPKHYSAEVGHAAGVFQIRTGSMWGACALIFPREVLAKLVAHPLAQSWLGVGPRKKAHTASVMKARRDNPHLIANSDTAIGGIINRIGLSMYYVSPSPVSHIATHSTLNHGGNAEKRNCFTCADHHKPLAEQVGI